jgi:hypothetical protein
LTTSSAAAPASGSFSVGVRSGSAKILPLLMIQQTVRNAACLAGGMTRYHPVYFFDATRCHLSAGVDDTPARRRLTDKGKSRKQRGSQA